MRRVMVWLWQREFLWRLSRSIGARVTRADLRRVEHRLPQAHMPGVDAAQGANLILARSLHAAVIYLEEDVALAPELAVARAREAFAATGTWLARGAVRLWLALERDPFAGVETRGPAALARALWGEGMALEERRRPHEVSLCVTQCPFQEYFWNAARSDLTPIVCAWDTAWHEEINASRKPIRVEMRGCLAEGAPQCDFTFRRIQ
ncbi:L-2-amino-thiazoline-4-carboxylic acid hydrolase [Primorskyibacter sp. S187A]|uniref:L-2-amino-thiazoline-4-carboxylic acid hydrolase n=1 Tax=Primorskyibacter sp. S187A TaxID=3415130 RepID=UPI003C79C1F3